MSIYIPVYTYQSPTGKKFPIYKYGTSCRISKIHFSVANATFQQ